MQWDKIYDDQIRFFYYLTAELEKVKHYLNFYPKWILVLKPDIIRQTLYLFSIVMGCHASFQNVNYFSGARFNTQKKERKSIPCLHNRWQWLPFHSSHQTMNLQMFVCVRACLHVGKTWGAQNTKRWHHISWGTVMRRYGRQSGQLPTVCLSLTPPTLSEHPSVQWDWTVLV